MYVFVIDIVIITNIDVIAPITQFSIIILIASMINVNKIGNNRVYFFLSNISIILLIILSLINKISTIKLNCQIKKLNNILDTIYINSLSTIINIPFTLCKNATKYNTPLLINIAIELFF